MVILLSVFALCSTTLAVVGGLTDQGVLMNGGLAGLGLTAFVAYLKWLLDQF